MAIGRPRTIKRASGGITLRKDGRKSPWMYRYWVGNVRKTGYARTRAIAEEKLNRALVLSADGMLSAEDPTFATWAELWLASKRGITEKTRRQYEYNLKLAAEFFGSTKLSKLGPTQLEALYLELLDTGRSTSTVHQIAVNVGTALRTAFRKGLLIRDIAGMAVAPASKKRQPVVLSREQWKSLIRESSGNERDLIVEFVAKSGTRISVEALMVTWDDIDFERAHVTITDSKTEASERVIPLDNALMARLTQLHTNHLRRQLASENTWNPLGLVFCTSEGNRQWPNNLQYRVLEPLLKRANLPRLTWHHLRHNFGSYLLAEGVPITTVSRALGHSHPGVTLAIYSHELVEDRGQVREAMAKLG